MSDAEIKIYSNQLRDVAAGLTRGIKIIEMVLDNIDNQLANQGERPAFPGGKATSGGGQRDAETNFADDTVCGYTKEDLAALLDFWSDHQE